MEYRRLEDDEYLQRLKIVITGSEGLSQTVENIGDGKATIGYGYTFNRSDNAAIWREAGVTLSEQDRRLLATVDAAADADKTRLALGFSKSLSAAEGDDLFRATVRRYNGPADSLDMPNSDERIALVSLAYNRGVGNVANHPVMEAIRDGDRAEAWFQIRYNSTAGEATASITSIRIACRTRADCANGVLPKLKFFRSTTIQRPSRRTRRRACTGCTNCTARRSIGSNLPSA
jgi:GH24 family phage-related lysozyme (muramidase)